MVSIHAPAWGATSTYVLKYTCPYVSIHAPAWGATVPGKRAKQDMGGFNPRARVGRDMTG